MEVAIELSPCSKPTSVCSKLKQRREFLVHSSFSSNPNSNLGIAAFPNKKDCTLPSCAKITTKKNSQEKQAFINTAGLSNFKQRPNDHCNTVKGLGFNNQDSVVQRADNVIQRTKCTTN